MGLVITYALLSHLRARVVELVRAAAGSSAFFKQRDWNNRDDENGAEQSEGVGVAHDRGLGADRLADGDDSAVHGPRRIGEAMRHEILLQIGEPVAGRGLEQRYMFVDDGGVKLLALGKVGLDRGGADRAAEVAHHGEEAAGPAGLRRPDPD